MREGPVAGAEREERKEPKRRRGTLAQQEARAGIALLSNGRSLESSCASRSGERFFWFAR